MSGSLPEIAARITQSIDEGLGALEARLVSHVEQLDATLTELERERSQLVAALEEHNLERMLSPVDDASAEDLGFTDRLIRKIHHVTGEYTRFSTLRREINDFVHLLVASRQQFRQDQELPGLEDAQRLAIRQGMIQAQEDERRRLAREVHDGPAQVLANAIIGMEFVGRSLQLRGDESVEQSIEEIERVKGSMREGLTEIRRFIFDLRPTMLSHQGLRDTVQHYIQTYRHLFHGEVQFSIPDCLPKMSPDQEMAAFRVIQESLQNVHRHARATETWVTIAPTDGGVLIQIRDNGDGFRPSRIAPTPTGGFGLAGMRERAEVIGGRLTVSSELGDGTTVEMEIPLNTRVAEPQYDCREESEASGVQARGAIRESGADTHHR